LVGALTCTRGCAKTATSGAIGLGKWWTFSLPCLRIRSCSLAVRQFMAASRLTARQQHRSANQIRFLVLAQHSAAQAARWRSRSVDLSRPTCSTPSFCGAAVDERGRKELHAFMRPSQTPRGFNGSAFERGRPVRMSARLAKSGHVALSWIFCQFGGNCPVKRPTW
jgi:hypothetical protein